ncbi:MAG: 50S ribosomal protein L10 [Planctomycetota bacterium]
MSKPVKEMMMADYSAKVGDYSDAMLVSIRGLSANDTNALRKELAKADISITVLRNNVARKAFEGTGLEPLGELLTGPNALAYGAETVVEVARKLVDIAKDLPEVELRGAVLDGELFAGDEGCTRLSKFPTRDEAIAQAVGAILSAGGNLAGALKGPAGQIAGCLKALEDKLEKGEAIEKIAG